MTTAFNDLAYFLKESTMIRLPVLINNLTHASNIRSYSCYKKYRETLDNINSKGDILNNFNNETFMRVLRIILGEFKAETMEAYYEMINRRFKYKNIPMSTEHFYDYIHYNKPR